VLELDVPYLDIFTPLQESAIWMSEAANDGSHPDSAGYVELARWVQSWSVCCLFNRLWGGSPVSDVLQGGRTLCTWMKTAWIRN